MPDVACTGFMQQGTTLDALIAECGDVLDKPGLTEMMTTYVILSRVRRATTILLLRAFPLRLFQQGCPPGPHCLLKLLRSRFTPGPCDEIYEPNDAIAEYHELNKKWDSRKTRKKHTVDRWQCFSCKETYPAEGFNAANGNRKEINECCILPFHWRSCIACTAAISKRHTGHNFEMRTCTKCGTQRTTNFYEGLDTECLVCIVNAEFAEGKELRCRKCNRDLKDGPEPTRCSGKTNMLCNICANESDITCSICKQSQPATNFSIYAQRASSITRCRTCSVACSECLRPCTSARMFATGASICWKCFKAPRTCSRCERQLSIHISASEAEKMKFLVCTACYNQGYRNDNIDEIPCREGHYRGTIAGAAAHEWTPTCNKAWARAR